MKQIMILFTLVLMVAGTALGACINLQPSQAYLGNCEQFSNKGEILNAGCCFYQIEEWGKCSLHFLKGARAAEILWDLNEGDFNKGATARQYYNPEFYPSTGLGSETGVCLYNYGDMDLMDDVDDYYDWIVYYYTDQDPPFDMDAKIATLEAKLYPPAATPTPEATATPAATVAPTAIPTAVAAPSAAEDNTGVLLLVALVIVAAVGYFMYTKKKPAGKKKKKESHRSQEE